MADAKATVRYIAESLAEDTGAIQVSEFEKGNAQIVRLEVAGDDMGRVIGRDGRIANAIRSLLKSVPDDNKWGLEITSPDED